MEIGRNKTYVIQHLYKEATTKVVGNTCSWDEQKFE